MHILHFPSTASWKASQVRSHLTHLWDNHLQRERGGRKKLRDLHFWSIPLFKLLWSQVSQALEVSNVLTFKGHIRFQRLLQKARHDIKQFQWELSISISASKAEKPSPWKLIYFQCRVCAQVILKTNSQYPEEPKIIVFHPKKCIIGRHKLFSFLLICRNEQKKCLFEAFFPKGIVIVFKTSS